MKVVLAANWFAGGRRYRRDPNGGPVEIPDHLAPQLPKSAKIVEGVPDPAQSEPAKAVETLGEFARLSEDPATAATRAFKAAAHAGDGKPGPSPLDPAQAANSALAGRQTLRLPSKK